jgi:Holliday junction resolvase RusA-like endonuclease
VSEFYFTVVGKPQTAGSKRSYVPQNKQTGQPYRDKHGRIVVSTVDDNRKGRDWKALVHDQAKQAAEAGNRPVPVFSKPAAIAVTMVFIQPRPKSHYGTGRNATKLKDSAPAEPTGKPDVLKLARAVEDAMSGVVYDDDCQITFEVIQKAYGERHECQVVISERQP